MHIFITALCSAPAFFHRIDILAVVREKLGQFSGFARPGCTCLLYPFENIVGKLSTRVQQLVVNTQTKTKDNVTLTVCVAVQFRVIDRILEATGDAPSGLAMTRNDPRNHGLWRAYYRLTNPGLQIQSYVEDTVRSELPRKTLDEAYEAKDDVAVAVKEALQHEMKQYGYEVVQTLVTDLQPDMKVISAMNEINAQRRMRLAAQEKAEAEKIIIVKRSEAEAEAKYLAGVGVARQRKAIVDGLKDSVLEFSGGVHGTTPQDVMHLMMVTQYLDMLKDVGMQPCCDDAVCAPRRRCRVGHARAGAQRHDASSGRHQWPLEALETATVHAQVVPPLSGQPPSP